MIRKLFKKALTVFWCLPGFLLWASFPPMGETADCLFALAPLLWLARQGDVRRTVKVFFLNGFLFWFATIAWMPAIVKNGGPLPLVVLGWSVLATYSALYFAAFGWLSAHVWNFTRERSYGWRLAALVVAEPILWAGLELVRSRLFGGFAWNLLGVIPVNSGFGAPAALGGVYLLSMVVILINGTAASIAERVLAPYLRRKRPVLETEDGDVEIDPSADDLPAAPPPKGPPNWARSIETFLPFGLVWCLFQFAPRPADPPPGEGSVLRVALVQRNFPCVFKGPDANPIEIYERLFRNVAPLSPDLIVLPESALCEIGRIGTANAARFATWACEKAGATSILAGGSRRADGKEYNSAALYTGEDEPQVYDKVHLVPFGEFIPGDKLIPALQKLAPVGSCTPGELKLLDVGGIRIGVAICFEDTDSAQMRRLAAMGAQALVFITNDSWFSFSDEAVQHAWQSVARAVETGLPVIRAGNSGVTGVVTPAGRVSWLVGPEGRPLVDAQGTMFDRVAVSAAPRPTPYTRFGDAPLFAAFLLLAGAVLFGVFGRGRRSPAVKGICAVLFAFAAGTASAALPPATPDFGGVTFDLQKISDAKFRIPRPGDPENLVDTSPWQGGSYCALHHPKARFDAARLDAVKKAVRWSQSDGVCRIEKTSALLEAAGTFDGVPGTFADGATLSVSLAEDASLTFGARLTTAQLRAISVNGLRAAQHADGSIDDVPPPTTLIVR